MVVGGIKVFFGPELWLFIFVNVPTAMLKATNHRTTPERTAVVSGTTAADHGATAKHWHHTSSIYAEVNIIYIASRKLKSGWVAACETLPVGHPTKTKKRRK